MAKVGIITDSIHGLSPDLIKKYDIRVAPMGVIIGGKAYRDTIDITASKFYPLFKDAKVPISTNAATPGDFLGIYDSLSQITDSMLYIGVSKAFTATYNTADQTRKMFMEDHPEVKIELLDSRTCMGCVGFLAMTAAREAEAGKNLPEIIQILQSMIPKMKYLSVLDTLRYLLKIGRIPQSAASEEKLKYRPLIGMTDNSGVMQSFPSVETNLALEKLMELAEKNIDPGKPLHTIIHYSEYLDEAEKLKEMFVARFKPAELFLTEYSPAALSSTGLMTGLAFYSD